MKFSEMKYERPNLDKVLAQCEEYAKKMAAAQSGEELVQLYREENAMMAHYHTASCLASIHYTQDTRDEYWSGEQEWFDATGPAVSNAARNVAEAILSNPHAKALEEAFGTRILPSLRNLVLSMDDRVIELQKEENALTSAYQKLYGGAMAELDGKQLTIPQLTLYKQSTDPQRAGTHPGLQRLQRAELYPHEPHRLRPGGGCRVPAGSGGAGGAHDPEGSGSAQQAHRH